MKKILFLGAIALFGAMNAQTEKGTWVVGGTSGVGFNNATTKYKAEGVSVDGPRVSTINVSPSAAYFVANDIAVGLDFGYTNTLTKIDGDKTITDSFSILPTATYYFQNESNIYPYLGAGLGYASSKTKYTPETGTSEETTDDGLTWKAKGGVVFFVTPMIGIDLGVSYNQFSSKNTYDDVEVKTKVNNLGFNAGISIFIPKKKAKTLTK